MCVTDRHDMTLAIKVAFKPNTTNRPNFIVNLSCQYLTLGYCFNSVPNDKFLDWSKLKAVADDKSNVAKKLKFVFGREENIVR